MKQLEDYDFVAQKPLEGILPENILCEGFRIVFDENFYRVPNFLSFFASLPKPWRPSFIIDLNHFTKNKIEELAEIEAQDWCWVKIGSRELIEENYLIDKGFYHIFINVEQLSPKFEKTVKRICLKWPDKLHLITGHYQIVKDIEEKHTLREFQGDNCTYQLGDLFFQHNPTIKDLLDANYLIKEFCKQKTELLVAHACNSYYDFPKLFAAGASYILDYNLLNISTLKFNSDQEFKDFLLQAFAKLWSQIQKFVYFSGKTSLTDMIGNENLLKEVE